MLTQAVQQDLVLALKQKNVSASTALRGFKAALQRAAIEARTALTAEQELRILQTEIKQRQDAIVEYTAGQRIDLADKERVELQVLQKYQPTQLSSEELTKKLEAVVAAAPLSGVKEFGPLMKQAMQIVQGQADGKQVQILLKQILARN